MAMNYISGALRYVAGGESEPQDIVPRLVDRIKTSALPHERRNAIVQLTEAVKESPRHQAQVGELSLKIIYAILEQDADFDDTIKATVELLIAICGKLEFPLSTANHNSTISQEQFERETRDAAATNIDVFLGLPNSLPLLLQLLDRDDFYTKFGTIELLAAMAANSRQTLQAAVLEAPQGVARICDILEDSHRLIRSNAVLLISTLCDQSPDICKIVVFGAVLEKLFDLIDSVTSNSHSSQFADPNSLDNDDDDTVENTIVVQDALVAIRTLINGTPSTKTFFRDSGCVPRLVIILHRAIEESALFHLNASNTPGPKAAGVLAALERQARKNLAIVLQCLSGLVTGSEDVVGLIKNDVASTDVLKALSLVAFRSSTGLSSQPDGISSTILHIKILSLQAMSALLRGHEGIQAKFSSTCVLRDGSDTMNAQISTLSSVLSDPSAALRLAAYSVLRDSFVANTKSEMPSAVLLNAMTDSSASGSYSLSENNDMSRGSFSPVDLSTITDSVSYVVQLVKQVLIGWPICADSAGVFYSAAFTSWILAKAGNTRDRLLCISANGSLLLLQLVRLLGKAEREKASSEIRVSLFTLLCVWLHNSPSAVSTFLSSAMHLPMLVDILRSDTSPGDESVIHIRGLAAVILGICLKTTEIESDLFESSGFLSSGKGASRVMSRLTVADVIRSRVGVTEFTTCLDELRATRKFSITMNEGNLWKIVSELNSREEKEGLLSSSGDLGHGYWYQSVLVSIVDDIYQHICVRAIDLVAEPQASAILGGECSTKESKLNGHMASPQAIGNAREEVLADSARDEVLHSYKEFIRSQDESISAARVQIEELAAALREAQVELDFKANTVADVVSSDSFRQLQSERDDLAAQKQALEALLAEKTKDYEDALQTLSAFEEEQLSKGDDISSTERNKLIEELQNLRLQNSAMAQALDTEMHKLMKSSQRVSHLEDAIRRKDAEIEAISREAEAIKTNVHPDAAEALRWRARAELAEESLRQQKETIRHHQELHSEFQTRLKQMERSKDEATVQTKSLTSVLDDLSIELDNLRADKEREVQEVYSSPSTNTAVQDEVEHLKAQLLEAQQKIAEQERQLLGYEPKTRESYERLQADYAIIVKSSEDMKAELAESVQASSQWEERAKASEAVREGLCTEINRLTSSTHELEEKVKHLTESLTMHEQKSSAFKNRVSELEQQCAELEELRQRHEEDARELKNELAMRTEQSIRLSGQIYEAEEAKAKVEQQMDSLKGAFQNKERKMHEVVVSDSGIDEDGLRETSDIIRMEHELKKLKEELNVAEKALVDSRNNESVIRCLHQDREKAIARADTAEVSLKKLHADMMKLKEEMSDMSQRILSLDEAEDAKRSLTMQVVELQQALNELTTSPSRSEVRRNDKVLGLQKDISNLKRVLEAKEKEAKELSRDLRQCEKSLAISEDTNKDLRKQMERENTAVSLVHFEKERLMNEVSALRAKDYHLSSLEEETRKAENVLSQLAESEFEHCSLSEKLLSVISRIQNTERQTRSILDFKCQEIQKLQAAVTESEKKRGELVRDLTTLTVVQEMTEIENRVVINCNSQKVFMLQFELSDCKDNYAQLLEERSSIESTCKSKYADWQGVSIAQVSELEELRVELDKLKTECAIRTNETQMLNRDLEAKNEEVQTATAVHTRELNDLVARLEEAEGIREALSSQISSLVDASKQREIEIQLTSQAHVMEVEKLRVELHEFGERYNLLSNEFAIFSDAAHRTDTEKQAAIEAHILKAKEADCKLLKAEEKRVTLSSELSSIIDVCQLAEKEASDLRSENKLLKSDFCNVRDKLRLIQDESNRTVLRSVVENVMSSIISDVSSSTEVSSLTLRLQEAISELNATVMSLNQYKQQTETLSEEIESMRALLSEHDEARLMCVSQKERLSRMFGELAGMQIICEERDQLRHDLKAAEIDLEKANVERDVAVQTLQSVQALQKTGSNQSGNNPDDYLKNACDAKTRHRISELEDALRDAARTVSATNKELIATQALLVELSSDKTAMRAELSNAEQQIHKLAKQVCAKCDGACLTPVPTEPGVLSEISEAETSISDKMCDNEENSNMIVEEQLRVATIETKNLRNALHRSIKEADTAMNLVKNIVRKVDVLEKLVETSQESLREKCSREKIILEELSRLKGTAEEERQQLKTELIGVIKSNDNLVSKHTTELDSIMKKAANDTQVLKRALESRDKRIVDIESELKIYEKRSEDLTSRLDHSRKEVEGLKEKLSFVQRHCSASEKEVKDMKVSIVDSERKQFELGDRLSQCKNQLRDSQRAHESAMMESRNKWERELKEYEEEIERCTIALEVAERGMRKKDNDLKSERQQFIIEKDRLTEQLQILTASLSVWTTKANDCNDRAEELQLTLDQMTKRYSEEYQKVVMDGDALKLKMQTIESVRDELKERLFNREEELNILGKRMNEECKKRELLEEENQELIKNTDWLEQHCKGLDEELKILNSLKEQLSTEQANTKKQLEKEVEANKGLKMQLEDKENQLEDLTEKQSASQAKIEELDLKVVEKDACYKNLTQDNAVLREWVGDLERQASALQNAACEFEQVEQSLRETLDSQRRSTEQINRLNEEIRLEREAVRNAEARGRKAERDQEAAEEALLACEQRLKDSENRLAEIRESSVSKLSASEASVRAQAQRCAELETALAEAQRQVAELGRASDEAFARKAELRRVQDELHRTRGRCEMTEGKLESLEMELRHAREEMEEMKDTASGEALRALEAEHNELLVYLADLELELTTLKEDVDRES